MNAPSEQGSDPPKTLLPMTAGSQTPARSCIRCAYDLSDTTIDRNCPECGLSASRSLLGHPIPTGFLPHRLFRRVRGGLTWLITAYALCFLIGLAMAVFILVEEDLSTGPLRVRVVHVQILSFVAITTVVLIHAVAALLVAAPVVLVRPDHALLESQWTRPTRLAVIALATLQVGVALLSLAVVGMNVWNPTLVRTVGAVVPGSSLGQIGGEAGMLSLLFWVWLTVAALSHLWVAACAIGESGLARRCAACVAAVVCAMVLHWSRLFGPATETVSYVAFIALTGVIAALLAKFRRNLARLASDTPAS